MPTGLHYCLSPAPPELSIEEMRLREPLIFYYNLSILVLIAIFSSSFVSSQGITCPIDSIYQFGDSVSDTGNLDRFLPIQSAASRPPYGETFPSRPTGRWSDGRLIIDYIAESLGLPLLNPYFDENASFENGVNFAVAGATTLSTLELLTLQTPSAPVPSLRTQLEWFQTYLATICSNQTDCRLQLNNSLVFVGEIGYNDIAYAYREGRSLELIMSYMPLVNQLIIQTAREVIRAGASQVVVPGLFPLGCFPFALNVAKRRLVETYDQNGCVQELNDLVASRNNDLQRDINSLRQEFPNVNILYSDLYNAFLSLLRNATALGFNTPTLLKACCGDDPLFRSESPLYCGNSPNVSLCPNPNTYIHWDGVHLTQAAHRLIANQARQELSINCAPYLGRARPGSDPGHGAQA